MKKFFTMALMSLVFMACNKEETQETPKEETHPIEGTWCLEKEISKGKEILADDCSKQSSITFSAGKFKNANYKIRNSVCTL